MARSLTFFTIALTLSGCATVPLGNYSTPSPAPSVSPMRRAGEVGTIVDPNELKHKKLFELAKPGTAKNPTKSPKSGALLSAEEVKTRLQDAQDKAESAKSVAVVAQSQDDWNLVFLRWERAISLLRSIPPKSPGAQSVPKLLAEYQQQLAQVKAEAKAALTPKNSGPIVIQRDPKAAGRTIILGGEAEPKSPKSGNQEAKPGSPQPSAAPSASPSP